MTQLTIGELLRRHWLDASLTQKQLANLLPYDHTTISRIERNERLPPEDYLDHFTEALHLTEAQFQEMLTAFHGSEGEQAGFPTTHSRREDWGEAPDVSIFFGRYEDLTILTQWLLTDSCRLIAILGMGGIGKTALVTKLAYQAAQNFKYIFWRSLRNAPPLSEILAEAILFVSDQQDIDLPEDTEKAITRLIDYLAKKRCLFILDNAESILQEDQAGHYRDGYEAYGRLLQRVGDSNHKSCLLVTSREKPREIGQFEGETLPVRSYQLNGLGQDEGRQLLTGKGVSGSDEAWRSLVNYYSGNPLALNLVAEMIREVYNGHINHFLAEDEIIFGRIGDVIKEQFDRLSTLEQSLMYWLAIEREPVSKETLTDNLVTPIPRRELMIAWRSLRRRSFIERVERGFTLQNVVMEYVTTRLIKEICQEIISETSIIFHSHALMKAQAREYVRESQVRLILKPLLEQLRLTLVNQKQIERKSEAILSSVRENPQLRAGYSAGNLLNLLAYKNSGIGSLDFSGVVIRQAYLQDLDLRDLDFSHSCFIRNRLKG